MRAISLFSGVGGFELGFDRAGIDTVLQVEQDPVCLSVLERHWPETERVTDVRQMDATAWAGRCRDLVSVGTKWLGGATRSLASRDIDLVYGGFPCQDVSVAGQRAGLSGQRSSLWFEFERILSELRPRWTVIENVPGLLSSNAGRDFARILMGLGELGYGWAYRVLDARWFGVPQRRRRVFIVGCLGDQARAAAVLAVCESCGGHPAARGAAGQDVAYALNAGIRGTGDGHGNAWNSNYVTDEIAPTLDDGARGTSLELPMIAVGNTLGAGGHSPNPLDETLVASAVRASDGHHGWSGGRGDGADNLVVASTLSGGGHPGSNLPGRHKEDDDNLIAFDWQASSGNDESWRGKGRQHVVRSGDYAGAASATRVDAVSYSAGVRRLTPRECNRLQGFPDDWDRYGADGREIPDSHRYRCMGNAVCVPVAEWLGHRLVAADAWPT